MHMCWKHVRRCTGACIRPKMCRIESRGECMSVCRKETLSHKYLLIVDGRAAQGWKSYEKRATANQPSVLKEKNSFTTDAMTGGSQDRNRQLGMHKVHDSCVGHLPLCGESGSKAPKKMLTFTADSTVRRSHKRSKISSAICACLFVLDLLRSCGGFQDRANRLVDV